MPSRCNQLVKQRHDSLPGFSVQVSPARRIGSLKFGNLVAETAVSRHPAQQVEKLVLLLDGEDVLQPQIICVAIAVLPMIYCEPVSL
jgi:hypothetical protein